MRVLMLSLDRGLFGEKASGDAVKRHQKYADLAGALDIIVFADSNYERKNWSANLSVIPTRSRKINHFRDAKAVALSLGRQNQYDLLVTQDFAAPVGAELRKELKVPWIVNIHGMFFSQEWLKLSPVHWYLFYRIKKAIGDADGFRVNNEVIRKRLEGWGIKKPILVQATPVDIRKFFTPTLSPPISRSKTGGDEEGVKILYVGRLSPEKNVGMLIRAVRAVIARNEETKQSQEIAAPLDKLGARNDVLLWIVGAGLEEQKLKSLAGEDARIKFLGPKSHEELISIYQEADIFALPSNTESFGKVLIEAGAAGCALVATKTPGAMGIIEEGKSGLLVEVGDEKALLEALQSLVRDQGLRARLQKGAQEMAKRHDAEEATAKTVEFWKEISTPSSSPPYQGGERRGV